MLAIVKKIKTEKHRSWQGRVNWSDKHNGERAEQTRIQGNGEQLS